MAHQHEWKAYTYGYEDITLYVCDCGTTLERDEVVQRLNITEPLKSISKENWDAILGLNVWPDLDDWEAWDTLTAVLRAYAKEVQ